MAKAYLNDELEIIAIQPSWLEKIVGVVATFSVFFGMTYGFLWIFGAIE